MFRGDMNFDTILRYSRTSVAAFNFFKKLAGMFAILIEDFLCHKHN
jgi:hypothetical protein